MKILMIWNNVGDSPKNVIYESDLKDLDPELAFTLSAIEVIHNKIEKSNRSNEISIIIV